MGPPRGGTGGNPPPDPGRITGQPGRPGRAVKKVLQKPFLDGHNFFNGQPPPRSPGLGAGQENWGEPSGGTDFLDRPCFFFRELFPGKKSTLEAARRLTDYRPERGEG